MLKTISVNEEALCPAIPGENILVAYIDEPFALVALCNFFRYEDKLDKEILKIMSLANDSSSWGTMWQTYLLKEFMFNGQRDIRNMPIFDEIAENYNLPPFCIGSPSIVKSSNETVPLIKNATSGYTLNEFFSESSDLRPAFFIPDNRCGPDIIFFVKFEEVEVPVFVQVKLRYSIKAIVGALSTIDPKMFYKDKNGDLFQKELNEPIVEKIKQRCEEYGSIGLLVAYPADVFQGSFVTNDHPHDLRDLRNQSSQQLIGIIDHENASKVFQGEHLQFLDTLKDTTVRNKRVNEKSEEVGGSGSRKKTKEVKKNQKKIKKER